MTSTPIPSPGRTAIEKAAFFIYAASQALWAMAPRDARRFAVASFVIAAIGIAPRLPPSPAPSFESLRSLDQTYT